MITFNRRRSVTGVGRGDLYEQTAKSIVAASFAYAPDEERYEAYCKDVGEAAAYRLRWPFWRIVAGSWVVVRFPGCRDKPVVEEFQSRAQPECDEVDVADALFEILASEAREPGHVAQLVTWGDQHGDALSLRRVAQMADRILPLQLRSSDSAAVHRQRLSDLTHDGSERLHLEEYVRGLELSGIPLPGLYLPDLIKQGDWAAVEEQCATKAMLTAVCAARHFASEGAIGQGAAACLDGIVEQFCKRAKTPYILKLSTWHSRYRYDRIFGDPSVE